MKKELQRDGLRRMFLASNKDQSLGLPRQWKVIASTIILLFTMGIGQMWGAKYYLYTPTSSSDLSHTGALSGDFLVQGTNTSASETWTTGGYTFSHYIKNTGNISAWNSGNYYGAYAIDYDMKTTCVTFTFYIKNTNSNKNIKWYSLANDSTAAKTGTVSLDNNQQNIKTLTITTAVNKRIRLSQDANNNVQFYQIVAEETGDPLPMPGDGGYSIDFTKNLKRYANAASGTKSGKVDGMEIVCNSDVKYGATTAVKLSNGSNTHTYYIKFTTSSTCNDSLIVTTASDKDYSLNTVDNAFATTPSESGKAVVLSPSTTYWIKGKNAEIVVNKIEFKAATPSCTAPAAPTITGTTAYTEGDNISLTASATGATSATFTWYKGADWATASAGSSVGTGATLSINSCSTSDAGTYWCNISNGSGCEVQVSQAITVSAAAGVCPSGISISGTADYTEGETIELTAALTEGNGEISYQWYKGSIEAGNEVGTNSNVLTIASCATGDAGDYFCVASKDDCSNATSTAYAVTVAALPEYTITYNANGGTGTMTATTGYGVVNLRTNTYTKSGFVFAGWATSLGNANAGTIAYTDGAEYNLTADADLYAVWYTVLYSFTAKDVASSTAMAVDEVVDASTGGTMTVLTTPASYETYGVLLGYSDPNKGSYQVTMSQNMSAGAKIIGTLYMTGSSNNRGVNVVNSAGTQKAQWKFTADGNAHKFTYNVIADDGFAGNNIIKFTRINNVAIQSIIVAQFVTPEIDYTVTIDPNGGSYAETPEEWTLNEGVYTKTVSNGTSFSAPAGLTKGTDALSWKDGLDNVITFPQTISGNITFVAQWTPTYTVTYSLNGASGDAPTQAAVTAGTEITLADAPSWAGHAFDGWLCNIDSETKTAGTAYTMTAANTTFTAQWHEVDCKIYSLTGGIGSAEIAADESNAEVNASSLVLKGSDAIIKLIPASGETFKAGDVITISGTVGNTTRDFGVKISATANKGDGLGTASVAGSTNPMIATATLSANADFLYICRKGGTTQTILTCEVHRSCAEGTAAGLSYATAEVEKLTTDAAFTNPLTNTNSLVLAGYKSSNTDVATVNFSTGAVTLVGAGSTTISVASAVQTKAGTLYAAGAASYSLTVTTPPTYAVTYAPGDGTGEMTDPNSPYVEGAEVTLLANAFTAPSGKEFDEWVVTKTAGGEAVSVTAGKFTMPAEAITVTATWKDLADKYTVIFKDGTTGLGTKQVVVGTKPTDDGIDKTKPLYTFAAWQKDAADIALDDDSWTSITKDAEITLTARWTKAYATSYDMEVYAASDGASKAGLETALTAAGYAYTNIYGIDNGHTHNNTYDGMKYKDNDGDLSFNVVAGKVVEVKTGHLPSNSAVTMYINGVADPTVFVGANEDVETHKMNYFYSAVEALYRLDVQGSKGTCAVKAVTIRNPYQVTFNANGGDPVVAQYGLPSVILPGASNGTQSLLGWFTEETGGTKIGEAGDTYTPIANIELFAHWEAVSHDARLASITFSSDAGTLEPAFDPEVVNYTYTMPYGTAAIPTITGATSVNANAKTPIIDAQAANWNDVAHIHGVAESDDTKDYYVTMKIAPKDGTTIFKAELTSPTAATYSGLYVDEENSEIKLTDDGANGYKFAGTSNYIKMALAGSTFATNDKLTMTYQTNPSQGELAIYNNTDKVAGTAFSNNTLEFPAGADGLSTLYIRRTGDNNFNGWVLVAEVKRIMNPTLKSITFDGTKINVTGTSVEETLPYATDLTAVTPEYYWNGAGTAVVTTNEGAWAWGENTYVLTDKDGDATTYTITLTRAERSHDATLSALTVDGNAITLVPDQYTYTYEYEYGTAVSPAPVVAATANDSHRYSLDITQADDKKGTATVVVVAEDESTTHTYTINFRVSTGQKFTIYDGSTMEDIELSGSETIGLAWTLVEPKTTSGTSTTVSFEGKSYTKCVNIFNSGSTSTKLYMEITIPDNYVAKFRLVGGSNGDSERSLFISKGITSTLDQSIAYATSTSNASAGGMTSNYQLPGTYYLCATASIRIYELSVTLYPIDYSRNVTEGRFGTICLPNGGVLLGADLYEVAYYGETSKKIFFDEILSGVMEAGVPYVFLPQEGVNKLAVVYTDDADAAATNRNGLVGFIGTDADDETSVPEGMYILQNNQYREVLAGADARIKSYRAYINLGAITPTAPALAPGRRRISMGVASENSATGMDELNASETPVKMMIDGQLYILRGEKLYDATGRLVK